MSVVWKNLEGHVINDALPLQRCVADSGHGALFVTESAKYSPLPLALRLVRFDAASAATQRSQWFAAMDLSHPHLIRLFESGQCELNGQQYLYALMEYADQNLAQLLEQRALDDDDMREMLAPTLSALAYLHEHNSAHGRLKTSRVLAVGDQLKLSIDTVCAIGKPVGGAVDRSVFDAPEANDGTCSAAGDIWSLGITMCEALTRRAPAGLQSDSSDIELPFNLHPPFRELIARCLNKDAGERPNVAWLQGWLRSEHAIDTPAATAHPAAASSPAMELKASKPSTMRLVIRAEIIPENDSRTTPTSQPVNKRALLVVGTVAALALIWVGIRTFSTDAGSPPPPGNEAQSTQPRSTVPQASETRPAFIAQTPPVASTVQSPSEAPPAQPTERAESAASSTTVNEVIPDVPRSARQTIQGTIRVTVRVTVDEQGSVLTAGAVDRGPSRYFERLSLEASRKWTFAPTQAQRKILLRFNFTRAGTTATADPPQ